MNSLLHPANTHALQCTHSSVRLAGSEKVKPRLSTFVLHIDQNVPLGNERSGGGEVNQRQILTVTKCGERVPPPAPPKALLREQLASVNYVKNCEVTWAPRPIRFKAAGHHWIYRGCTSQEHVPGQRKTTCKQKIAHTWPQTHERKK